MAGKRVEYVEGCPDCVDLTMLYTPERVRRIIRRIAKAAMLAALGDEMINVIEKPPRRKRSSHANR